MFAYETTSDEECFEKIKLEINKLLKKNLEDIQKSEKLINIDFGELDVI